jgi:hypothetical protein
VVLGDVVRAAIVIDEADQALEWIALGRLLLAKSCHEAFQQGGTARASAANASSNRQRPRSGSLGAFEIARSSTAGTPASSAARRTLKPSIASTSKGRPPPTRAQVAIGSTCASGGA